MGAEVFITRARGKTAQEAFQAAYIAACEEYGNGGYTGTIAEKDCFVMIRAVPVNVKPEVYAQELIDNRDPRINDKWGPAGCIDVGNGEYVFFGWASS